jgi:hypothetical protein
MTPRYLTTAVLLTLALTGCSTDDSQDTDMHVTSEDIDPWPLTVDAGDLECDRAGGITITVDGARYAVNGISQGEKLDPIWAYDQDIIDAFEEEGMPVAEENRPRIPVGALIEHGRQLCQN